MEPRALPDYLIPGLRLVVVGLNPGLTSARLGHYYARPGNLFWPALHASGLTSRLLRPEEDHLLPRFGIGLTDVVGRTTASADALDPMDWASGAEALVRRLSPFRPATICFNGIRGARAVLGPRTALGLQPSRVVDAVTFVVPSTSRRNATYSTVQVFDWYRRLAALVPPATGTYWEGPAR